MVGKLSVLIRALTRPDSNPGAQLFYIQSPISQVFTQGVYVAKKLYLWVNKHADHISDVCLGVGDSSKKIFDWNLIESL